MTNAACRLILAIPFLIGLAAAPAFADLTCREAISHVVDKALTLHAVHKEYSPQLVRAGLEHFIQTTGMGHFLLLEDDVEPLAHFDDDALKKLILDLHNGLAPNFEALRRKALGGLDDVVNFLDASKDRRALVLARAAVIANKEATPSPSFPRTPDERRQLAIDAFARSYLRFKTEKNTEAEAYVMAVRAMNRMIEEARVDLAPENLGVLVAKGFMQALDPHSDYLTPEENAGLMRLQEKSYAGIGVTTAPHALGYELTVHAGSPAEKAGLRSGDVVTAVDGHRVRRLRDSDLSHLLRGPEGSKVKLDVIRDGEGREIMVVRDRINAAALNARAFTFDRGSFSVGVIAFNSFSHGVSGEISREVNRLKKNKSDALVLDLRHNGGGLVNEAQQIMNLFIEQGPVVTMMGQNEGSVLEVPRHTPDWNKPLFVLVDHRSASASELLASALKAYGRAVIIGGRRTHGKGTAWVAVNLPNGGAIKTTQYLYYDPSGKSVQGSGLEPDVVLPEAEGPKGYEDEAPHALTATRGPMFLEWTPSPRYQTAMDVVRERSAQRIAADPRWRDQALLAKPPSLSGQSTADERASDMRLKKPSTLCTTG